MSHWVASDNRVTTLAPGVGYSARPSAFRLNEGWEYNTIEVDGREDPTAAQRCYQNLWQKFFAMERTSSKNTGNVDLLVATFALGPLFQKR